MCFSKFFHISIHYSCEKEIFLVIYEKYDTFFNRKPISSIHLNRIKSHTKNSINEFHGNGLIVLPYSIKRLSINNKDAFCPFNMHVTSPLFCLSCNLPQEKKTLNIEFDPHNIRITYIYNSFNYSHNYFFPLNILLFYFSVCHF